jgi:hypothetical protein
MILADRAREHFGAQRGAADPRRIFDHGAEREVEFAAFEKPGVSTASRRNDRELDARRFVLQRRNDAWQNQGHEEIGCRDDEAALRPGRLESRGTFQHLRDAAQGARERFHERFGVRCERHSPSDANQQLIVEEISERGERVTHC